jgi:hypothetical protein
MTFVSVLQLFTELIKLVEIKAKIGAGATKDPFVRGAITKMP